MFLNLLIQNITYKQVGTQASDINYDIITTWQISEGDILIIETYTNSLHNHRQC